MGTTTGHKMLAAAILPAVAVATLAGCSARTGQSEDAGRDETIEMDVLAEAEAEEAAVADSGEALAAEPEEAPTEDGNRSELAWLLDRHEVSSVLLIGDSLTAGYGCDSYDRYAAGSRVVYDGPEGTYRETPGDARCWANEFREYASGHGVAEFANAGISGAKMWWLARSPESWLGDGADAIVVMLGTNDAVYSTPDQFEADAEKALSAAASKCRCLVVMSPPANDRTDATNRYGIEVIDERLRTVCERNGWCHVSLLDALDAGAGDLNDDMCHPTTQGSHRIWERMREALGLR